MSTASAVLKAIGLSYPLNLCTPLGSDATRKQCLEVVVFPVSFDVSALGPVHAPLAVGLAGGICGVLAFVRYVLRLLYAMWVTARLSQHPEHAADIINATLRRPPLARPPTEGGRP
jgi:hypothetical protein